MKIIFKIAIILLVLLASCEKSTDNPYTLKFYGDAYEDIGYSVAIANDGYIIAGQLTDIKRTGKDIDSYTRNLGIIKTGWNGNIIWKTSTGGKFDDWGYRLFQDEDGSLICVGTFTDTTTATAVQTDIFIVKLSASGVIEWQKKYGGSGNQTGKDIAKTAEGFMILGSTDVERQPASDSLGNYAGNTDILLLRISNSGDSLGSRVHGYGGNDSGVTIKPDTGGNYIVLGTTDRSPKGQVLAKNNLILLRVNSLGEVIQTRFLGGMEDEYAADMEVLPDGYLLAYTVGKSGDEQDVYVTKLKNDIYAAPDFTNLILITNPNTGDNSASVFALSRYKTDSYLIAGQSGKGAAGKFLIFEIDATGNLVAGHQMIKGSTGTQVAYDVVSGDDEYIIAVGKNSYDVNSMMTFLKFKF